MSFLNWEYPSCYRHSSYTTTHIYFHPTELLTVRIPGPSEWWVNEVNPPWVTLLGTEVLVFLVTYYYSVVDLWVLTLYATYIPRPALYVLQVWFGIWLTVFSHRRQGKDTRCIKQPHTNGNENSTCGNERFMFMCMKKRHDSTYTKKKKQHSENKITLRRTQSHLEETQARGGKSLTCRK